MQSPTHLVVGIAGGSASGKSTFARELAASLGSGLCHVLSHDAYYRDLTEHSVEERSKTNFDHPDSLENSLLATHVDQLRLGRPIDVPRYDYRTHARLPDAIPHDPRPILIVEGILVLAIEELRERFDLSLFVDASDETRLARRMHRDIARRGRTEESVRRQFAEQTRPMHEQFVQPSADHAHFRIQGAGSLDTPVSWIRAALRARLAMELDAEES